MSLRRIIWLASFHKSGNTWLRAFLANYFAPKAGDVGINRLFDEIGTDVRQDFYNMAAGKPFRGETMEDYLAYLDGFYRNEPNPKFGRPYRRLIYLPMVELVDFLKISGFDVRYEPP